MILGLRSSSYVFSQQLAVNLSLKFIVQTEPKIFRLVNFCVFRNPRDDTSSEVSGSAGVGGAAAVTEVITSQRALAGQPTRGHDTQPPAPGASS